MEFDRRRLTEAIVKAGIGVGVTAIITPFLIDAGNAGRVIDSLVTNKVDCGAGIEP